MNPLPCLICGKDLPHPWGEGEVNTHHGLPINQPSGGTAFDTRGNYGSSIIDSISDTERVEIAICDECMSTRLSRIRRIYRTYWSTEEPK